MHIKSDKRPALADFGDNSSLLRQIYDADPTLIFVKDREGHFVFANKALADVYGTAVDSLIGKTDTDFNPDLTEIEHFLTDDLQVMDQREELFIAEEPVTDAAQNTVWLQTTKRPLVDDDGECNHVLGVSYDITARKQAEQRERDLQAKLARSQRMESLGVMAGGIAHDLNNILGPLVAYPDLIKRRIGNDPTSHQMLDDMTQAVSRATAVILDLLTLTGRGTSDLQPLNINDIVTEYLGSASFRSLQASSPAIHVCTALAADLPLVLASATHYYQLVMNLVANAVEAMANGGQLTISTCCASLEHGFTAYSEITAGNHVLLEVTDTGEGIPADLLGSIFEPFVSSKMLGRSGSGLGLAVVYGVLQNLHGHIDVHSIPHEGSCFRVGLPALASDTIATPTNEVTAPAGTGTILVVDDLQAQRTLATRVLEALGYRVLLAANYAEALDNLRVANVVDLALIDMVMPNNPDGLDTFRAIRALCPELPCIIVSGYAESERIRAACAEGALGLVKKPYSQQTLGQVIRNALNVKPAGE